jgi:hypothetical protein
MRDDDPTALGNPVFPVQKVLLRRPAQGKIGSNEKEKSEALQQLMFPR